MPFISPLQTDFSPKARADIPHTDQDHQSSLLSVVNTPAIYLTTSPLSRTRAIGAKCLAANGSGELNGPSLEGLTSEAGFRAPQVHLHFHCRLDNRLAKDRLDTLPQVLCHCRITWYANVVFCVYRWIAEFMFKQMFGSRSDEEKDDVDGDQDDDNYYNSDTV